MIRYSRPSPGFAHTPLVAKHAFQARVYVTFRSKRTSRARDKQPDTAFHTHNSSRFVRPLNSPSGTFTRSLKLRSLGENIITASAAKTNEKGNQLLYCFITYGTARLTIIVRRVQGTAAGEQEKASSFFDAYFMIDIETTGGQIHFIILEVARASSPRDSN